MFQSAAPILPLISDSTEKVDREGLEGQPAEEEVKPVEEKGQQEQQEYEEENRRSMKVNRRRRKSNLRVCPGKGRPIRARIRG